jgi:hypothetical protein
VGESLRGSIFEPRRDSLFTEHRNARCNSRFPSGRNRVGWPASAQHAPGLWMEARESIRARDIVDAVEKSGVAFQTMFDTKIRYSISSGTSHETDVLAVICPFVSEEMSDSKQALEVAAIDVENATELLGLATAAAFGKWRDDESVTLTKTRQVSVQSSRDIPLFLDGERVRAGKIAEITFVSRAVNVIVPAKLTS